MTRLPHQLTVDHVDESAKRSEERQETVKSTKTHPNPAATQNQPKVTNPKVKTGTKELMRPRKW